MALPNPRLRGCCSELCSRPIGVLVVAGDEHVEVLPVGLALRRRAG
jgi:hypothetical protein